MNLFEVVEQENLRNVQPLAVRMRPRTLDEVVGQEHLLHPDSLLRRTLASGILNSLVLFGPPGCGKTSLAQLLAQEVRYTFQQLHALSTGVKEIRECLDRARERVESGAGRTVLFIDEVHRLHRGQQEVMLREAEEGIIVFVGATTANPFYVLSSALLSRCQVYEMRALEPRDLQTILTRAMRDETRGLGGLQMEIEPDALDYLSHVCDGDARRALQILEWSVQGARCPEAPAPRLTVEAIRAALPRKAGHYDRSGDAHYDHASALIKSIRGSDPDAAIYWLARMLEAGEDVRFLCRRLLILASEDIGNADPQALILATAAMQACEFVGLPECQFALAQATLYLALCPKSNACTMALAAARRDVRETRVLPVPRPLRDSHGSADRILGRGEGYVSPHDDPRGIVAQSYLGVQAEYYVPSGRGAEAELERRLQIIRQQLRDHPAERGALAQTETRPGVAG